VSNACTVGTTNCASTNPADICCGATGTNAATCQAGNCCTTADCTGSGVVCAGGTPPTIAGVCSACAAATGNNYYVDPVTGSDATGTGSNVPQGTVSCAFKTVTRALQIIKSPMSATTITVLGDSSIALATGEKYPLLIPANVTVTAATGPIQINGNDAFRIVGGAAGVSGFNITGTGHSRGIELAAPVGSAASVISDCTVSAYSAAGVAVKSGNLTIGNNIHLDNNKGDGIDVFDIATLSQAGSGASVSFNGNGGYGIRLAHADINFTGDATMLSAATVTISDNSKGGVLIDAASKAVLAGLLISGSKAGNGVTMATGATVKLRRNVVLGNSVGVVVNASGTNQDVSTFDFGATATGTTRGGNVFQVTAGGLIPPNSQVGLCLNAGNGTAPTVQNTLLARGNIFAGPRDCSATSAGKLSSAAFGTPSCTGTALDVSTTRALVGFPPTPTANNIATDNCTQ
jgi:hypothetical protein